MLTTFEDYMMKVILDRCKEFQISPPDSIDTFPPEAIAFIYSLIRKYSYVNNQK